MQAFVAYLRNIKDHESPFTESRFKLENLLEECDVVAYEHFVKNPHYYGDDDDPYDNKWNYEIVLHMSIKLLQELASGISKLDIESVYSSVNTAKCIRSPKPIAERLILLNFDVIEFTRNT